MKKQQFQCVWNKKIVEVSANNLLDKNDQYEFHLIEDGKKIHIGSMIMAHEDDDVCYIDDYAIEDHFQKKWFGKCIFQFMETQIFPKTRCDTIELSATAKSDLFWDQMGFKFKDDEDAEFLDSAEEKGIEIEDRVFPMYKNINKK